MMADHGKDQGAMIRGTGGLHPHGPPAGQVDRGSRSRDPRLALSGIAQCEASRERRGEKSSEEEYVTETCGGEQERV